MLWGECSFCSPEKPEVCGLCLGLHRLHRVGHSSFIAESTRLQLVDRLRILYGLLLDCGVQDPGVVLRPVAAGGGTEAPVLGATTTEGARGVRQPQEERQGKQEVRGKTLAEERHLGGGDKSSVRRKGEKIRLPKPLKAEAVEAYKNRIEASLEEKREEEESSSSTEAEEEEVQEEVSSKGPLLAKPKWKAQDSREGKKSNSEFIQVKVEPTEEDAGEEDLEEDRRSRSTKVKKPRKDKKKRSRSGRRKKKKVASEEPQRSGRGSKTGKDKKKRRSPSKKSEVKLVPRSPSRPPPGRLDRNPSPYPKPSARSESSWDQQGWIPSRQNNPYLRATTPDRERSKGIRKRERWIDIQKYGPSSERKAWYEANRGQRWWTY